MTDDGPPPLSPFVFTQLSKARSIPKSFAPDLPTTGKPKARKRGRSAFNCLGRRGCCQLPRLFLWVAKEETSSSIYHHTLTKKLNPFENTRMPGFMAFPSLLMDITANCYPRTLKTRLFLSHYVLCPAEQITSWHPATNTGLHKRKMSLRGTMLRIPSSNQISAADECLMVPWVLH